MAGGNRNSENRSAYDPAADAQKVRIVDGAGAGIDLAASSGLLTSRVNRNTMGSGAQIAASGQTTPRIMSVRLSAEAAVKVTINDTSVAREVINLVAGVPYILPYRGKPYWVSASGGNFSLVLSAAVQVDGIIEYTQV